MCYNSCVICYVHCSYLERQAFLQRTDFRQFEIERNLRVGSSSSLPQMPKRWSVCRLTATVTVISSHRNVQQGCWQASLMLTVGLVLYNMHSTCIDSLNIKLTSPTIMYLLTKLSSKEWIVLAALWCSCVELLEPCTGRNS